MSEPTINIDPSGNWCRLRVGYNEFLLSFDHAALLLDAFASVNLYEINDKHKEVWSLKAVNTSSPLEILPMNKAVLIAAIENSRKT